MAGERNWKERREGKFQSIWMLAIVILFKKKWCVPPIPGHTE